MQSFTSPAGGNMVDGLPPAINFRIKHNFSILFLRFLWGGKFILAISIFGWLFLYIKKVP